MSEKEPTPEEIREAEALARALEGDGSSPDLPEDALQTAALLRSHELAEERSQAVFDRIVADTAPEAIARAPSRLRWLVPVGGLAAAVLVGFLFTVPHLSSPGQAPPPPGLPAPDAALLRAQGEAARTGTALAALGMRMNNYRKDMYRSLSERYPE